MVMGISNVQVGVPRRRECGRLGRCALSAKKSPGGAAHTSVGQRPTFGQRRAIKAVSLEHSHLRFLCARLTALNTRFRANVGRCPTLVCSALSGLAAHGDMRPPRMRNATNGKRNPKGVALRWYVPPFQGSRRMGTCALHGCGTPRTGSATPKGLPRTTPRLMQPPWGCCLKPQLKP